MYKYIAERSKICSESGKTERGVSCIAKVVLFRPASITFEMIAVVCEHHAFGSPVVPLV
jgi:hypothetical protein